METKAAILFEPVREKPDDPNLWIYVKRENVEDFTYTFRAMYGSEDDMIRQVKKEIDTDRHPEDFWEAPERMLPSSDIWIGYVEYESGYTDYIATWLGDTRRPADGPQWFLLKYLAGGDYDETVLSGTQEEISEKIMEMYAADNPEQFVPPEKPAPVIKDGFIMLETYITQGSADYIAVRMDRLFEEKDADGMTGHERSVSNGHSEEPGDHEHYDIVLAEKETGEGLKKSELDTIYKLLDGDEAIPIEVGGYYTSAMGLISMKTAEHLGYDYDRLIGLVQDLLSSEDEKPEKCRSVYALTHGYGEAKILLYRE